MNIKKYFILTFLISVGFFPTDIFLYAQKNNNLNLNNIRELIDNNEIDSSYVVLSGLLKDTLKLKKTEKAELYYLLSKVYSYKNKEEIEFKYNKKAEKLFRETNNNERLLAVLYTRFEMLINQKNLLAKNEAIKYLNEFYEKAIKSNDSELLVKAYKGYARVKMNPQEYKQALLYYDLALKETRAIKDTLSAADIINNKGLIVSYYYNNQDSARFFFRNASNLYKLLKNKEEQFGTMLNTGLTYMRDGNFKNAIYWFLKADSILLTKYKNNNKKELYGHLANAYENLHDYKNALDYVWLYNNYKDSVNIMAQNIAISDISIKYKTLEKEKKNIELLASNKKKKQYIISIASLLLLGSIFGYLGFRDMKIKKEMAEKNIALEQQKFVSLVKNQELLSIDAMIEGQEIERKKIAEDLHDNLGSTLATLKLHFDSYKTNILSNEPKQLSMLNNTEKLLNEAYNKVRSMAHVNQAGVLADYSLVESVKSLAHNISLAKKTEIQVIEFGFDKPLRHTLEITLFRIIQELITNIVKHANAKKAIINLTLFEDYIGLIIEDDGKGFNMSKLNSTYDNMGLQSIKNKVIKLNGTFNIDSNVGIGTSVLIEIPLKQEI